MTEPVPLAIKVSAWVLELAPSIVPPKAMEPPVPTLQSIVRRAVLLSVVGTVPATVKEFAWILVIAVPMERADVLEPIVTSPKRVVVPIFAERVTLLAVDVSVRD